MRRKIHFPGVLEDEQTVFAEQSAPEDRIDDSLAALQIVGRIRKNHVELLPAAFHIEKGVGLDRVEIFDAQPGGRLPDEIPVHRIDFHRRDAPGAARGELVADRPRTCEQVEHVALLEIDQIAQHVEQVFLGEIRRGARPQVAGRVDGPALVFSAYDSHTTYLKRLPINLRRALAPGPAICSRICPKGSALPSRSMK